MCGIFSALIAFNCYSTVVTHLLHTRMDDINSPLRSLFCDSCLFMLRYTLSNYRIEITIKIDVKIFLLIYSWDKNCFKATIFSVTLSIKDSSRSRAAEHSTETINQLVYFDIYTCIANRYPLTLEHDTVETRTGKLVCVCVCVCANVTFLKIIFYGEIFLTHQFSFI